MKVENVCDGVEKRVRESEKEKMLGFVVKLLAT